MSLFPFWRTSLGQVYNWLSERVWDSGCCWCMDPGLAQCQRVLWDSGGWHMTGRAVCRPCWVPRIARWPALPCAQDTPVVRSEQLNTRPLSIPHLPGPAQPELSHHQSHVTVSPGLLAPLCVIGKCCHLPLTFDISLITHGGHEWLCGACGCGRHPHVELITPHNFKHRPLFLEVMLQTIEEGQHIFCANTMFTLISQSDIDLLPNTVLCRETDLKSSQTSEQRLTN